MKKFMCLAIVITLLSGITFADVVKKTKAEVSFKEFGKFTTEQEIKITSDKKLTKSKNKFKGKGVLGSTVGKMFLKSGETGEIINLAEMKIYDLNHKKKEFTVRPMKWMLKREKATSRSFAVNSRWRRPGIKKKSTIFPVRNI